MHVQDWDLDVLSKFTVEITYVKGNKELCKVRYFELMHAC